MRIALVGSGDYLDLEDVRRYVNSLPDDSVIISGATRGQAVGVYIAGHLLDEEWNGVSRAG